jgi:Putative phage tail protein
MSGLLGGQKSSKPPHLNNIVVQQSAYGIPLTIGWGTNRTQANLVWYNGFRAVAQKQSSGKGGGSVTTGYSYYASVIMALGEGPITAVRTVYKDQNVYKNGSKTALQQAGLSLNVGSQGQATWGYLTTNYPTQALGYSRTAICYASNYPLTSGANLSNHSFEVQWATRATVNSVTIDDALLPDIVTDFLTNSIYGVPLWGSGLLADMTACRTYVTAAGLWISPVLASNRTAADCLTEWLDASNCDAVFSGGQLKIVPLGDTAITANGVTYTPNLTPSYNLTEDDFIVQNAGEDPVKIGLAKQADAFNSVQIEFSDRALNYNTNTALADDMASIANYGSRREDPHTLHCICDATVASAIAQLRVQRLSNLRRSFTFNLDWRYCLLEPLDLVTLTSGDLNQILVRINEVKENADGGLEVTAEEMLVGANHAATYTRQTTSGTIIDTSIAPGSVSAPVLINPPRTLTNGDTQIWLAVSSTSASWGGCQVYTSLDGVNYQFQGTITSPARYGTLTSSLGAVADPDTTSSFGVNLSASLGSLNTATAADANGGSTLCLIDSELITYQAATLTSTYNYTLGTLLRRGQLGTTVAAHSSGAPFIRLDGGIFKYSYTANQNGKTVYVKFCSFNVYGQSTEDISTVTAYSTTLNPASQTVTYLWTNLSGVPGNLTALNGSEAIQNSILQTSLTSGSVVPATSSSIVGQSAWATYNTLTPTQLVNKPVNLLYNPTGMLGMQGWPIGASTIGTAFGSYGEGYYFFNGSSSQALGCYAYQDISCQPGVTLSLSGQVYAAGVTVSTGTAAVRLYIGWLNSSKTLISYSGVAQAAAGSSWTAVQIANQIAPAGTAYARVYMDIWGSGNWTNTNAAWKQIKLEPNTVCTPYSDDATFGAAYQGGTTIDSLKPAQINADVTGSNTAAAIAGQGALATAALTAAQVTNTNITISGGVLTGIGTTGVTVDNSLVTATGIGAVKTDGSNAPASILNSSIAISGGAITGIGTGTGTAVANSLITIGANGALSGAGGGTVTLTGLGAGALATLGSIATGNINSNAVTQTTGAYTQASFGFFSGTNTVQTITYTATGGPCVIAFGCAMDGNGTGGSSTVTINRVQGATTSVFVATLDVGAANGTFASSTLIDTPAAGSVTYNFIINNGANTMGVSNRSLSAVELKR